MTFLLTGLDIEAKADLIRRQIEPVLRDVEEVDFTLAHTEHEDADTNERAVARFTVSVKDSDGRRIGRPFSGAAVELALASYPGATMTSPPGDASPYGVYQATYLPNALVDHRVVTEDGTSAAVAAADSAGPVEPTSGTPVPAPPRDWGPTWRVPLGSLVGARSGDKGGNANLGVWARSDQAFRWLDETLTVPRFKQLLPETAGLTVQRHVLPNLRAINFIVEGLLGEGVASSTRQDPQAKGLGEWLRSRYVDIPTSLMEDPPVDH
jgi:hypothetical protein